MSHGEISPSIRSKSVLPTVFRLRRFDLAGSLLQIKIVVVCSDVVGDMPDTPSLYRGCVCSLYGMIDQDATMSWFDNLLHYLELGVPPSL